MKLKKGYALVWAMILIIIASTVSIGIFRSTEFVAVETRMGEQERIRGYYAAIAGLRYARILLDNPGALFTTTEHDGEVYQVPSGHAFFGHIGVDPADLTITIREWQSGETEWNNGEYQVTATYTIPKYSP